MAYGNVYVGPARARPKKGLTTRQKIFVKEYIKASMEGRRSPTIDAAIKAYGVEDRHMAGRKGYAQMDKPQVRAVVEKALEEMGLTPKSVVKVIKEGLEAKAVHYDPKRKKGERVVEVGPDHGLRLRAGEVALELMDAYPGGDRHIAGEFHQHLHFDEPVEVTRFIVQHGRYPSVEEKRVLGLGVGAVDVKAEEVKEGRGDD